MREKWSITKETNQSASTGEKDNVSKGRLAGEHNRGSRKSSIIEIIEVFSEEREWNQNALRLVDIV